MNEERKVNVGKRGGTLRGSVALCEDFGRKGRKERKEAGKDGTMNHQTTKLSNHQTIWTHAEAQRGRGAEEDGMSTNVQKLQMSTNINENSNRGPLCGSVALCEDFGRKGRKERKGAGKDGTMNGQTVKRSNGQTVLGQLARWAAAAAGGRGMRLEGARGAHTEAQRHGEGRGGLMGRMGHTGLMGHMARWAAAAAGGRGERLEGARVTHAEAQRGRDAEVLGTKVQKEQKVEASMSNHQASSDERRETSDEFAVENHQTAKLPNHQTGSDERRVTSDEFAVENHQTTKLPNHQTGSDERRETSDEFAVENHQTAKLPNHQTILGQLGRWAAVAAVAAGTWLGGAREAELAA